MELGFSPRAVGPHTHMLSPLTLLSHLHHEEAEERPQWFKLLCG